jgi:hypothetical protein
MPESPKRGSGIAYAGHVAMLNEQRATGAIYDPVTDVTRVFVADPAGTVRTHTVPAELLLDAQGFLVGLDLDPEAATRTIVMLGRHEDVARKASVRVGVCTDASAVVFEVRVAAARTAIRGDQKNPHASF